MKIKTLEKADLPGDWNRIAPSDSTKDIGANSAASMASAVLSVPFAVVDRERNYLPLRSETEVSHRMPARGVGPGSGPVNR
jgi:hypothetical protein